MAHRIDLAARLEQARTGGARAFARDVNPAHARLLTTLGLDVQYTRGVGQYLWDSDGNKILDCLAGYGSIALGRNHPVVVDALQQCLAIAPPTWVHFELNPLVAEAARMLKACCGPGLDHVFFANSGAEGVEAAIKMARRHTGRAGLLGWTDCFHGLTSGALSLNGSAELQDGFGPLLPGAALIPFGDLAALERALSSKQVAALIVEPVQGKTLLALPPGVLKQVHALCHAHGTLLVADEVQTGVGRTGRFLACHHDGVAPDIAVLSKALSGGNVPVSATLVRADVWNSTFSSMDRAIVHSTTFQGGALAMTALIATLEVVEQDALARRAERLGVMLKSKLIEACQDAPAIAGVHGMGLMLGVEINADAVPSTAGAPLIGRATAPLVGQAATMSLLHNHRILAQTTGARRPMLKFIPPLILDESDVDWIAAATGKIARELRTGSFFKALGTVALNVTRAAAGQT